jgi:membrane-associated phospholipid phosphatase
VNRRAAPRSPALPLDRLFAAYVVLAGAALLFPNREPGWALIAALHVAGAALLLSASAIIGRLHVLGETTQRRMRATLDWAPLLLVPMLYTELALLNRAVHGGTYFDDIIIRWEQAIFGGMPSSEWAAAAPHLWLSEPLHAAYLSYYFIILGIPLALALRGRTVEFRKAVFALMLVFFAHYLFFVYFPVQGPRYLFPPPGGELAGGYFYQLAHRLLEAGSSQGAAFPSSHVGVSVAQTVIAWRYAPRLMPITAILTLGLAFGAVYGGFHYATDAVAGVVLGVAVVAAAPPLYRALGGPSTPAH